MFFWDNIKSTGDLASNSDLAVCDLWLFLKLKSPLKRTEACFLYLISSSINVFIFHITWMDFSFCDSKSQKVTINLSESSTPEGQVIISIKSGLYSQHLTLNNSNSRVLWLMKCMVCISPVLAHRRSLMAKLSDGYELIN